MVPTWQRILGFFIYMLPWSEALIFGNNLFLKFSFLKLLIIPALPMLYIERLIPFGDFLIFLILFLAVIRNPKIPYFLRFNTLQALLLCISLFIISYFLQIIINPLGNTLLIKTISDLTFIVMLAVTIFSSWKCFAGEEPDLPGISEAVRLQI